MTQRPEATVACVMVVHYHFDKSAGTALRDDFKKLLPSCRHRFNRVNNRHLCGQPHVEFAQPEELLTTWSTNRSRRETPLAYVEKHTGNFVAHHRRVEALRRQLQHHGSACRVLTVALVREPAAQIISAYKYWGGGRSSKFNHSSLRAWMEHQHVEPYWGGQYLGCDGLVPCPNVRNEWAERDWASLRGVRPCRERGKCTAECSDQIGRMRRFLEQLDIVAPTSGYYDVLIELAAAMRLTKLPYYNRQLLASPCEQLRHAVMSSAGLATAAGLVKPAASPEELEMVRRSVPCSPSLYRALAANFTSRAPPVVSADLCSRRAAKV